MMNDDDTPPMSTSTPSVHNTPLDKLSYKELQVLAMSLNLPGKMKVIYSRKIHLFIT